MAIQMDKFWILMMKFDIITSKYLHLSYIYKQIDPNGDPNGQILNFNDEIWYYNF